MSTCTHCGHPARWRADGEPVCGSHATDAALRGRRVELTEPLPMPAVEDLLQEILDETECLTIGRIGGGGGAHRVSRDLVALAAAEIRRLRARVAALEAGQTAAG